jgi:hypothetical protein
MKKNRAYGNELIFLNSITYILTKTESLKDETKIYHPIKFSNNEDALKDRLKNYKLYDEYQDQKIVFFH